MTISRKKLATAALTLLAVATLHTATPAQIVFSGPGAGTEEDPYLISTFVQLLEVNKFSTAHYALVADIDASATASTPDGQGFKPLHPATSTTNLGFRGVFDGRGHRIIGLTITRLGEDYLGLFGAIGETGVVRGVILENVNIWGDDNIGGIVGLLKESSGGVYGCQVTGSVRGNENVGGIAGYAERTVIDGCRVDLTVRGDHTVGGILGNAVANPRGITTLNNCWAEVEMIDPTSRTGGIAGNGEAIRHCIATGTIVESTGNPLEAGGIVGNGKEIRWCTSQMTIQGASHGGGLAGAITRNGSVVTDSIATGSVTGIRAVGGLVGYMIPDSNTTAPFLTIQRCAATGNIIGGPDSGTAGALGWIGRGRTNVSDTMSTGSAAGATSSGGFVGIFFSDLPMLRTYSTGAVSGTTNVGGLCGNLFGSSSITDSYYSPDFAGITTSAGGTSRSAAAMRQQSNYVGWDFTNTWIIVEGVTTPLLRSIYQQPRGGQLPGTPPRLYSLPAEFFIKSQLPLEGLTVEDFDFSASTALTVATAELTAPSNKDYRLTITEIIPTGPASTIGTIRVTLPAGAATIPELNNAPTLEWATGDNAVDIQLPGLLEGWTIE